MTNDRQQLIESAVFYAREARAILAAKGAPFEQTAAGKLTLALEALCGALLLPQEEQDAEAAFWLQINGDGE